MSAIKYDTRYKEIIDTIDKSRLGPALNLLSSLINETESRSELTRLQNIKDTYGYLLHYFAEGYDDDMRSDLYRQTVTDLYSLADRVYINAVYPADPSLFFSTMRLVEMRGKEPTDLIGQYVRDAASLSLMREAGAVDPDAVKANETLLSDIFESVWVRQDISGELKDSILQAVVDDDSPKSLKFVLISALLLGTLKFYSREKLLLLTDIYDRSFETDENISSYALVAIMLVFLKWPQRIQGDELLRRKAELWSDSLLHYSQIKEVASSLVRTRDTDRISDKMKTEVIPELIKINPKILKHLKDKSFESDFQDLEQNPEWEELLHKSGLADKMKELSEMQSEGSDVMMVAFSNLKRFPFFNKISNWFIPFDRNNSSVSSLMQEDLSAIETILDLGGMLCDSDKYSFILSLGTMPEGNRNAALGNLQNQFSHLNEEINSSLSNYTKSTFNRSVTNYIRNLYRFMKLFRLCQEFDDPFKRPFDFISLPYIGDILDSEEFVSLLSEFYFKRGYYSEALPMLEKLEDSESCNAHIYEKTGYCRQMAGDYMAALEDYNKALLFNPESEWLQRKIAFICKKTGDFKNACQHYAKLVEKRPEDVSLIMNLANVCFELENNQEALQNYYRASYLDPTNRNADRAIAWCEFIEGNYEKSRTYYEKLFSGAVLPSFPDYVNYSYLCLADHNYKKALELLRSAASNTENGYDRILKAFDGDRDILESKGIRRTDLNMFFDKLFMDITD